MEEKLDFSLPEKKQRNSFPTVLLVLLLLILVGLTSAVLFVVMSRKDAVSEVKARSFSAEQTKQLAGKLAQRNLYDRAARVWQDYLAVGELTDAERAKALFQIGTLLEKANSYAEAIEYYYRSEITARLAELEPQINAHIKDCFEKLGKFSALRYELIDRTSFKKSDQAGGKVVAEIGAEKITEADLDAKIENDIENRLSMWAAFMTDDQLKEQKKKMLEQYKSTEAKQRYLQSWLTQEILYRQALEEQLTEKPEVKKLLEEQARGILSQHIMNQQLAARINITETDLQTYYTANKSSYVEPAKAQISHILVDDEQQAKDLIGRIRGGEDFAKLAKEFSKDASAKESGGKIDSEVSKGSYVPGIGNLPDLNAKIFAADAPSVLDEPVKTEKGWEIIRVEQKQAERQKGFEEVREEVMSTLLDQKRQDVQQDYIKQMMDKYNVVIHTSALSGAKEGEPAEKPAEAAKSKQM
ncbi:MAG TPA: peptidyl-prolyl cis-trans isomerase [Sedimentisphaerales bacterium]|nr:peptidyl-prolyl cis-trans isomerase [Sedimentisphaerales bacterium]